MDPALGKVISGDITFKIGDDEFLVGDIGIKDIVTFRNKVLAERRNNYVRPILESKEAIVDNEGEEAFEKRLKTRMDEASEIQYEDITQEEFSNYFGSVHGAVFLVWFLVERRYPGRYSKRQIENAMLEDKIDPLDVQNAVEYLMQSMGILGNSLGSRMGAPEKKRRGRPKKNPVRAKKKRRRTKKQMD